MSKKKTPIQEEAYGILKVYGPDKGREYIIEKLYFSGSATNYKLLFNAFNRLLSQ